MTQLEDIRVGASVSALHGREALLDCGLFDFEAFGLEGAVSWQSRFAIGERC